VTALDVTHVQQLLAELLEHGYGEVQVRVHDHAIASITIMPIVKHVSQVDGIRLALTDVGTRASVTR
jgi:hypothetical protein